MLNPSARGSVAHALAAYPERPELVSGDAGPAAAVSLRSNAVASTLPAGGAVAVGVSWAMLSSWGLSTADYVLYWALCDDEENGQGTLGLATIALVAPACARDCDSGCSGPRRHLTIQVGQVVRHDKSYPPAETNAACSGGLDAP